MTRQTLRNTYPFHQARTRDSSTVVRPSATYNRHSLRHRVLATLARVRNALGL